MEISSPTIFKTILPLSLLLFFLSLPSPSLGAAMCNPYDKIALLRIKAALNNSQVLYWDPNTDCCSWFGVFCDSNSTGRVVALLINNPEVSGLISPAIGNLRYIQAIDISYTSVTGTIPSNISKLAHLTFLRLKGNKLSGAIPPNLGYLKKMKFLDLSFNLLSGSIPPELSALPNLLDLHLNNNYLSGLIPESFVNFAGGNTPNLYLSNNFLSGTLPKSFASMNSPVKIDLSFNNFTGDASFLFGKNTTLTSFELNSNSFVFDLSNVTFPVTMTNLVIDHNRIFGSLPQGLTQLKFLRVFNVSYNSLCGQIPQGGRLQSFASSAYDHNKCLCGAPLPACH